MSAGEQLSAGNLTDTVATQGVVEQHHVEIIPESDRHGRPRDQFTLWFAANANVVNFTLGVLAIEFYEALEPSASVRYLGSPVAIRSGLNGVYSAPNSVLWWISGNRYFAIQDGGPTFPGVQLAGGVSEQDLLRMAAST